MGIIIIRSHLKIARRMDHREEGEIQTMMFSIILNEHANHIIKVKYTRIATKKELHLFHHQLQLSQY